jgi:poly(hydroxyalkanoate) depolymerase family esterase
VSALLRRAWLALLHALGVPLREGRWSRGTASSARGVVGTAPLVAPRRDYLVYEPRGYTRWRRLPLVVLCHGCRQTPEAFAQGTRMARAADDNGWMLLMPRQRDTANPWSCWNWFDRATAGGDGEAAIVAAMACKTIRRHHVDTARVIAAGMSAGGALAAILGVRHPALIRGVVVHSGLACGAATSVLAATGVMARGPDTDVAATGAAARDPAWRVPLLAIHGLGDDVVAPRNAIALARQYLALGGVDPGRSTLPAASREHDEKAGTRSVRVRDFDDANGLLVRLVEIAALGHAWSGGDPALPYNDAAPPAATALIRDWMRDLGLRSAKMHD